MKNLNSNEKMIVNMAIDAYVSVMGIEKWNRLTEREQHDAIMAILNGINKAFEA